MAAVSSGKNGKEISRRYVNPDFPHFVHGADYNPEQWKHDRTIWDEDMRLMRLANCNEMTVGIFSWAEIEPSEGTFDFSVPDEILDKIHRAGGKVILATPSGARPRWLAEAYPDVLRVSPEGQRYAFGERHNHCYTSPAYREKVKTVNTMLARRYASHPAVIGWHVSNEYGGECFCPLCREAFREYLRKKFDNDIGKLNIAYWTAFWSHTYTDFSQIEPPSPLTDRSIHGLNLDWRRFVTLQTADFMRAEVEPLKEADPSKPVTTNMMCGYEGLDYFKFRDILDFASWDCYPQWHSGDQEAAASEAGFWHDFYRCLKNRPFFLMESTPSMVNWHPYNKPKRPGMDVLSSLQAVAHGSDSVQYFQFRKSRGSCEKLHGAVVGHDGTEHTRVFRSVAKTGSILKTIDEVCGTAVKSDVALLLDWENMWALNDAQGYARDPSVKDYFGTLYAYESVLSRMGVNLDVIHPEDDLSSYRLVIAPMLYLTTEKTGRNLISYVNHGGTLLATYFAGTVDENDLCFLGKTPGRGLHELFGVEREETDVLYPDQTGKVLFEDRVFDVKDFAEVLKLSGGANALAVYEDDFYKGTPALTVKKTGSGSAYYQAFRGSKDFTEELLKLLLRKTGVRSCLKEAMNERGLLPYGISAHTRTDGKHVYLFVGNYEDRQSDVLPLGKEMLDMLSGEMLSELSLPPFGFAILKYEIQDH